MTRTVTLLPNKKILRIAILTILFVLAFFLVVHGDAWAEPAPAPAPAPTRSSSAGAAAFQATAGAIGSAVTNAAIGVLIIHGVLWILYGFLIYSLTLVGGILNYAYSLNIAVVPGQLFLVQEGWTLMRDLANGLFILIVLWIAITIIFNLENLGGKKLLVRVIVIALLINFSLVMVTTVFALANQLALPFSRALGIDPLTTTSNYKGVAEFIITNSRIHTVSQIAKDQGVIEELNKDLKAAAEPQLSSGRAESPASRWLATIRQSLGASQAIPPAQAGPTEIAGTVSNLSGACAAVGGALFWTGIGLKVGAVCGAVWALSSGISFISSLFTGGSGGVTSGVIGWEFTNIVNLAVADLFLLLMTFAMLTAAVLLLTRIVAMVFIGVFAPLAFLGMAVPRYGERIWNMWSDNLFRWALVAPIFYFLLHLSLLMLKIASTTTQQQFATSRLVPFQGNALTILSFIVFLAFFWASIFLTRKAAGIGAEAVLAMGKRAAGFGVGVVTGGVARRALPAAGRFATALNESINRSTPLRAILGRGPVAYGLRRAAAASRQQVIDRQRYFDGMTSEEIQQGLASGAFRSPVDVAASGLVLQRRKQLAPVAGMEGYGEPQQRRAKNLMKELGLDYKAFVRANPMIAEAKDYDPDAIREEIRTGRAANEQQAAWRLAWKDDVRAHDLELMDLDLFRDKEKTLRPDGTEVTKGDLMKEMFLEFGRNDHLTRLGRINSSVAGDIQTYLETVPRGQQLWNSFDEKKKDYFVSNAARELAWRTPPYAQTAAGAEAQARPVIEPITPETGRVGQRYNQTLRVRGGMPAGHSWRINPRTQLPPGLTLDAQTGVISGTTTAAGLYAFYIELLDPNQTPIATQLLTIEVE